MVDCRGRSMNQKLSSSPTNLQKLSARNLWFFPFTELNMKIRATKYCQRFLKLRQKSGLYALNFRQDCINMLVKTRHGHCTKHLATKALLKDQFALYSSRQVCGSVLASCLEQLKIIPLRDQCRSLMRAFYSPPSMWQYMDCSAILPGPVNRFHMICPALAKNPVESFWNTACGRATLRSL